jgi:hypothetical protein
MMMATIQSRRFLLYHHRPGSLLMPDEGFKLLGSDGSLIATGSVSAVTEQRLDSTSRIALEDLIKCAADAAQRLSVKRVRRSKLKPPFRVYVTASAA